MNRGRCATLVALLCLTLAFAGCTLKRQPRPALPQPTPTPEQQYQDDTQGLEQFLQQQDADSLNRGAESQGAVEPPGPGVQTGQILEQPRRIPEKRISFDDSMASSSGQRRASNDLVKQGRSQLNHGKPQLAMARFEKAIQVDSSNPFAFYYMAEAQYKQGHYDQAEALASKAADCFGNDGFWISRCHLLRSRSLLARGEAQAAFSAVERSLTFDGSNAEALELERQLKLQLGLP